MTLLLESHRLKITIEEPGRIYQGSRFDMSGNITQVILDGKTTFCTTEKRVNFDGRYHGRGFYNEFGINKPFGYDDCSAGDTFPKIGVGLLTRTGDGPYDFFASYPVKPFEIEVGQGDNLIRFNVKPENCRGYAVNMVKTITLEDTTVHIDYLLENTGTKAIHTNEYCHNFVSFNHSDIDENYSLNTDGTISELSDMIEAVNPESACIILNGQLNFNSTPAKDIFFSPFALFSGPGMWELKHRNLGTGIREHTDFIPSMMNVWGTTHVISPELFVDIDISPGHSQKWRRTFKFYSY